MHAPCSFYTGLKHKYGEVITFNISTFRKEVVLNSAEAVYEGFVKQADKLSNRPPAFKFVLTNGRYVLI